MFTPLIAYLDPFTGSMVLQLLAAGFVGFLAFFKPIINLFTGKKKSDDKLDDWDESSSDETSSTSDSEDSDNQSAD